MVFFTTWFFQHRKHAESMIKFGITIFSIEPSDPVVGRHGSGRLSCRIIPFRYRKPGRSRAGCPDVKQHFQTIMPIMTSNWAFGCNQGGEKWEWVKACILYIYIYMYISHNQNIILHTYIEYIKLSFIFGGWISINPKHFRVAPGWTDGPFVETNHGGWGGPQFGDGGPTFTDLA